MVLLSPKEGLTQWHTPWASPWRRKLENEKHRAPGKLLSLESPLTPVFHAREAKLSSGNKKGRECRFPSATGLGVISQQSAEVESKELAQKVILVLQTLDSQVRNFQLGADCVLTVHQENSNPAG